MHYYFQWPYFLVHQSNGIDRQWTVVAFTAIGRGGHPIMGLQDMLNIGCGRNGDTITILMHIEAIEIMEETKVLEQRLWFGRQLEHLANLTIDGPGNILTRAGHGKVGGVPYSPKIQQYRNKIKLWSLVHQHSLTLIVS
jgi:hypothetical protein